MNSVNLMGRLATEPTFKTTSSDKMVTSFVIAVNRKFSKDNEADFIQCVAWGNTAKFISTYFEKGKNIAVTGRLQVRNYEDKNGKKQYVTEVIVEDAYFCGDKKSDTSKNEFDGFQEFTDDCELPF